MHHTAYHRHGPSKPPPTYRLWVNTERTILVRHWSNGRVEVATREHESHTWGPPVALYEENV